MSLVLAVVRAEIGISCDVLLPLPQLWRRTNIVTGCFRNCVDLEVLGRVAAFLKG